MKKILVVDDDPDLLDLVKDILMNSGYEIELVQSWHKVYEAVRVFQPQLVLLDIHLAGIDGRILCRNLRAAPDNCHVPIILCSSDSHLGTDIDKCGADAFLPKPFSIEELMVIVKKYTEINA